MSIVAIARGFRSPTSKATAIPQLYPILYTYRAASLARAIGKGIRRSKDVGFRGREKGRDEGRSGSPRGGHGDGDGGVGAGAIRRTADIPVQSAMTRKGWVGAIEKMQRASEASQTFRPTTSTTQVRSAVAARPASRSAKTREGPVRIHMGKRIVKEREDKPRRIAPSVRHRDPDSSFSRRSKARNMMAAGISPSQGMAFGSGRTSSSTERPRRRSDDNFDGQSRGSGRGDIGQFNRERSQETNSYDPRSQERGSRPKDTSSDFGNSKSSYEPRSRDSDRGNQRRQGSRVYGDDTWGTAAKSSLFPATREKSSYESKSREQNGDFFSESKASRENRPRFQERASNPSEDRPRFEERSSDGPGSGSKFREDRSSGTRPDRNEPSTNSGFSSSIDKRIPLSIPYTTPASEFLYGTSVVDAALRSKRVPRRKYYKLYIYTGEKRERTDKDADIERLARRSGIEVARVAGDWLRVMDKMSASRPHNGYILEASPLPRLPLTSLGELTDQDGEPGFEVSLDYQSREDAAINGTSNFIQQARFPPGRKPLVLFLDSILDPGNLGGIIRTASFLGVTAVAISKNCAAFSPVVLKASAGASEDINIFTVNKPAGFIADSKLAGWKIFAAVAPSGQKPAPVSTDDLISPLSEDPCILMLGSEGEGLRMNLRSKADVNLTVRGSGQSLNVDSLNVSVATGILCNAFLRRGNLRYRMPLNEESNIASEEDVEETGRGAQPVRDLF